MAAALHLSATGHRILHSSSTFDAIQLLGYTLDILYLRRHTSGKCYQRHTINNHIHDSSDASLTAHYLGTPFLKTFKATLAGLVESDHFSERQLRAIKEIHCRRGLAETRDATLEGALMLS